MLGLEALYLGLKHFRLRFSFWAHMLLSWVSVIFQGTLKWKNPPLSSYRPVHRRYITSKGMDVEVLVVITERGF